MSLSSRLRQRAGPRVRRALTENPVLKLLSMVLAVAIWAWLQGEQVVDRRERVSVSYAWPEGLVVVEEVPKTLVVTVRGPQGLVRTLEEQTLSLSMDLSESAEGPLSVDFDERALVGVPDGLEIVQISPPGVEIQLDKRMRRTVKVTAAVIGEPAEGWKRVAVRVEPRTLEIEGPQSKVRTITSIDTDIVDISGFRKTRTVRAPLAIAHHSVWALSEEPVEVTVELEPILQDRTFTEVPVAVNAGGWSAQPGTAVVTLVGPVKWINQLRSDEVRLEAALPTPVPLGGPVEVHFDPDAVVPEVVVRHSGPRESIEVREIMPDRFVLEPTP